MGFMSQSLISSSTQLESIKFLIKEIKDEKIKQFFIILMIRIIGIGFFYDINRNFSSASIDEKVMKVFKSYKIFILDLYSLSSSFSSTVFDLMLRESLMITIFIGGKYLFIPDSYEELHDFMKKLLSSSCSQSILRCLADFMFSFPSSLYIIDQTVYEHLLKIKNEIDINSLFIKNSSFIQIEDIYTTTTNDKIIEFISPYIQTLFNHFRCILSDESTPIIFVEELFASIISSDIGQINLSLILEKELVGISKAYYERVRKIPEVIKSENEFNDFNVDYKTQEVIVGVKVIESQHPYNLDPLPIRKSPKDEKKKKSEGHKKLKKYVHIDLGTVDFGGDVNKIYIKFDPQSNIYKNDAVTIYNPFGDNIHLVKFNEIYNICSNKVRIAILRSIDKQPKENKPFWGVKAIISGVYSNEYEWKPSKHLNIFNCFIYNLSHVHQRNFYSTSVTDSEKDFKFIMIDRFIQGINLADIQNYEESLKSGQDNANNISRKMSRGISRGISYDSETKSDFDDKVKKDFINGIITAPQNQSTQYKRFLDCIYTKSSKRSFLKPNEEILEIERYFAACLFKQLGLITMCLNFSKIVSVTPKNDFKNIEVPNRILDIWKKNIYPLRNKLHFAFQRSNSDNNNSNADSQSFIYNFKEYSKEIKNKCIVLLYSDPILKFKDKGNLSNELFESTMKSIFSFVTSKTPLKDITKIIEVQRKRLDYSSQSLSNIITFVDQNSLFNSSRTIFSLAYDCSSIDNICQGLSQRELDEYKNLLGLLSVKYVQNIFVKPSLPMVLNIYYLCMLTCTHKDKDSQIKCSKMIIDALELNKDNKSSFHHRINFSLVLVLTLIAIQSKNKDLSNYLISLLSKEDLDSESKILILIMIPFMIQVFHDNSNLLDESLVFSILENNKANPSIIKYMFYWSSSLFALKDMSNHRDFIVKVFKGIGQSFIGRSCLFIDDSFKPLSHRQVSETMISFIRLLFNSKNELLFSVIHDILTNNLKDINEQKEEEMFILIGLFASLGSSVSAMEPNRFILNGIALNLCYGIKGYCRSGDEIKLDEYPKVFDPINTNVVLLKYVDFSLSDKEIDNILQIHESMLHSKHFNGKENVFKNDIDNREITENILISTFYSFLSIIMQNVNNMNILLNEKNIKRTLSLCEISNQTVPSNTNSILLLSHYLEQAITNPLYNETDSDNILNDSIKFMKMNYGEIIYGKENDIIKTNKNYVNVFLCNRIFDYEKETYFNLKVDNINSHSIFIGFIDAEETELQKSFGFGTTLHDEYFYRNTSIPILNDEITINDVKSIGCYYTKKYVYLLINGCLTPYRVSHPTLMSYIPIIYIDCDELEVQILQNVTIVDHSNDKFNFLNIDQISEEKFEEKDIKKVRNGYEQIYDMLNSNDVKNNHKYFMIGQEINVNVITPEPLSSESKDLSNSLSRIFYYKSQHGVIKDISIVDDNEFTVNINGLIYNRNTLSYEKFDLESKYISFVFTKFFNIVENRINTRFGLNSSMSVKHLQNIPDDLNSIRKYVKWKTINDNSKSIAIIMSRYLVFILLDYLRFSKSNLLQEEGINSNESQIIINALAHSLPTITLFSSSFVFKFANENKFVADDYLIFQDEQTEKTEDNEEQQNDIKLFFKIAGNYQFFNVAFIMFMKKSENFVSPQFLLKLIQASYEIASKSSSITHSYLYDLIPTKFKLESVNPLTEKISIEKAINIYGYDNDVEYMTKHKKVNGYAGLVPILLSSIPDQLPSALLYQKRTRISSDKISYFATINSLLSIIVEWKYDINTLKKKYKEFSYDSKDYKNYEFKLGFYILTEQLPEFVINSPFGFIVILLLIFRSINYSEFLYEKHQKFLGSLILEKIFSLTLKKNPLFYPFVEPIILALSSSGKFSNYLLTKEAIESFSFLSSFSYTFYPINQFPSSDNETPIIFCIYSNLINGYGLEKSIASPQSSREKEILNLFNDFININDDLFDVFDSDKNTDSDFTEGTLVAHKRYNKSMLMPAEKKKNYRLFYQIFFYSILLNNENELPYPKFLFYHDWIRQHFGSFRIAITKEDFSKFNSNKKDEKDEKEICFKSENLTNDFDLECSCKIISIIKPKEEDNKIIEINDESNDDNDNNNNDNGNINGNDNDKEKQEEKTENTFKVFIHQLTDDKRIEIPQTGEKIKVSFPLEIVIINPDENFLKKFNTDNSFIIDFSPLREQQKQYFFDNYNQLQDKFNEFISLGKYDTQLTKIAMKSKEIKESNENSSQNEDSYPNENDYTVNNIISLITENDPVAASFLNNPFMLNFYLNYFMGVNSLEELAKKLKFEATKKDFKFYELEKIPSNIDLDLDLNESDNCIGKDIICLRYWILMNYNDLIEEILLNYTDKKMTHSRLGADDNSNFWSISFLFNKKKDSIFSQQIIKPAYSMNTESKFRFINQVLLNDAEEQSTLNFDFNRFEARKFADLIEKKNKSSTQESSPEQSKEKPRPLLIQFMQQIDTDSLHKLKVHRGNPFHVNLIGENAIDAGGPAREIFSNLIIDIMNNELGIFTFNPNHRNSFPNTNKEDLIPNIHYNGEIYKEEKYNENASFYFERFKYGGALIAVCIVSDLPQHLKLASFVWEFLAKGKVETIESIYEVDEEFKNLMKEAENCKRQLDASQMTNEIFNDIFVQTFKIKNSFGKIVDLVPNGSNKKVTPENITQFIELAKNYRINEFDLCLRKLKDGFDMIMTKKEITSILRPNELKLLVCGEPNCPVEQMKKLMIVTVSPSESEDDFLEYSAKMTTMFWNVIESLSVEERIGFIRFSSGSNGLPAVGMKWKDDFKVNILSKEQSKKKVLPESQTCFSTVNIYYFENEEKLAKVIRTAINDGGLITDGGRIPDGIENFI